MMGMVPTIDRFMNNSTHTIGEDESLAKAGLIMSQFGVRHLPVVRGERFVGIISDRDLKFNGPMKEIDPETVKVKDFYTPNPFVIAPESPLPEVCSRMAQSNYSCALVCDNNKLVGVFSWIDAFGAFSELLMSRYSRM